MQNIFLITSFFFLTTGTCFSTTQYPDIIIFQGKKYELHSNPLERFFEKNPEKKPMVEVVSTALWRGYVATFEVRGDGVLYVKDVEIRTRLKNTDESQNLTWKSVINEVFENENDRKIDWFSGILVLPYGEMKNYVHMGYASTYSNYHLLEVYEGKLTQHRSLDEKAYLRFKNKQFKAFQKTKEYRELVEELKQEFDADDKYIEGFLRDYVIDYTSKFL
jgi:hypothetical protein